MSANRKATTSTPRTRVACKNCNARRVRCHRTSSGESCSNCQLLNAECQLIESKRGKYKRASRTQQNQKTTQASQALNTETSPPVDVSAPSVSPSDDRGTVHYASPSLPPLVIDQDAGNGHRVVYMGDSSNMKYLIHEVGDPFKNLGRRRLWGEYLQQSAMARLTPATHATLAALQTADDEHLRNLGAFNTYDPEVREELVDVFFDRVYPFLPIFDKTEFQALHRENRISPLLSNAVYSICSIYCSDELIRRLGFDSRYLACSTFYQRAKALHEKDHEKDAISNIQACILLMNWWQEPMEPKDCWFWLGVASHIAQGLGMHRAKSYQILSENLQRLRRRIWWVLFTHDIHHAAVYGRPPHIHTQYSDVPVLSVHDMASSAAGNAVPDESDLFAVEYGRLAVLLDQCLQDKYSATASHRLESQSWLALKNFPATLPASYKRQIGTVTPRDGFYPAILELVHMDYLIVVERMFSSDTAIGASGELDSYFKSAGSICRVLENLLASPWDLIIRLPFVAFPAIYCSIGIHIMYLRREARSVRLVAEHRARFGMVVSDQLQDRWPFAVWTHYLLNRMLKNAGSTLPALGAQSSQAEQQRHLNPEDAAPEALAGQPTPSAFEYSGSLAKDLGDGTGLPESITNPQADSLGFPPGPDGTFSPLSFMFPWNSFIEDGMEIDQWLL